MRFLSLFSGIEAASAAWLPLGWECVAVAEIEPFPCKVLAHHYPDVPNLGDITKITKEQIEALGHIDLVVGGFPCQDLSVAGKRQGFTNDDGTATRSGLFYTALRIAEWANPRWLLLENVPGIYSSNSGRDFGSMVGEILRTEFDVPRQGWQNSGVASSERGLLEWATLDAQHFGVPQRRRRMFALADFGNWSSREPVLFERDSLQGNPAPSREKRKEVTEIAGTLTSNGGGLNRPAGNANELDFCIVDKCLTTNNQRYDFETETFIPTTVGALCARDYKGVGNQYVAEGKCIPTSALAGNTIGRQPENGGNGNGFDESGVSYTLTKTDVHAVAFGVGESPDLAHCLRSGASKADKHESTTYIVNEIETLYNKGIKQGEQNASTKESNAREILRALLQEIGEESFTEWGFGILNSLQPTEVLQQALHGVGLRCPTVQEFGLVDYALSRKEDCSTRVVCKMRKFASDRCSSFGWESHEQRTIKLGSYLSELSQPRASAEKVVCDLWEASEGVGILHKALSTIQEIRGCANDKNKSILKTLQVRRLTPTECEFLQGFPRNYTNIPGASDSARYKALGNSMAVPVMNWIGKRIQMVEDMQKNIKQVA